MPLPLRSLPPKINPTRSHSQRLHQVAWLACLSILGAWLLVTLAPALIDPFRLADPSWQQEARYVLEQDPAFVKLATRMQGDPEGLPLGIYIPGILALPVIEQPKTDRLYVSAQWDVLTLYQSAEEQGNIGILAHNYLAGGAFYQIPLGHAIWLVDGDDSVRAYTVSHIQSYQRLKRSDAPDEYIDLETNRRLTSGQVFARAYGGRHYLTLQTCLERDGNPEWGLIFVVAKPADLPSLSSRLP